MAKESAFKLTYATMFNPPEELHTHFEDALTKVKTELGREHSMLIGGQDRKAKVSFENRSPINIDWILGKFQQGDAQDAADAIKAARVAFPGWSKRPWQERLSLLRKAADLINERIFEFGAVIALEVGKNRMEALGDIAAGLQSHQPFGPAPLWSLAGGEPLQFSRFVDRRACRRGAGSWQYHCDQARIQYALDLAPSGGVFP